MTNIYKTQILDNLRERFGCLTRLPKSRSLFTLGNNAARIYFRYSKVHPDGRTFFGLRDVDLRQLEGQNGFVCLFVDSNDPPLFIPYADFEEVFRTSVTASDGQHKVQLILQEDSRQLYIARKGRFNVEGYVGMAGLERSLAADRLRPARDLSHSQVQTLIGAVGRLKGFDVWVPQNDVGRLDWSVASRFAVCARIPAGFEEVASIISEVDVVWISAGSNNVEGLFEVEHSTPIYSGLLRFNDVLLTMPRLSHFHIVSNDARRGVFSRQAFRPTFRKSGLSELVSFLEYSNVWDWHDRLKRGASRDVT